MPKVGSRRKKTRTQKKVEEGDEEPEEEEIPKSYIIKRGKVPKVLKQLVSDMREVFYPNTAKDFKESNKMRLRDFQQVSGELGFSHMMMFSSSDQNKYLRIMKNPKGPTFTFKILKFTLRKDIANAGIHTKKFTRNFNSSPLLVINGFRYNDSDPKPEMKKHYELMSIMLQSQFPPLNLDKMKIDNCKRVVLFALDKEKEIIEIRHYWIKPIMVAVNKKIKNLLDTKNMPDLSKFNDISDFLLGNAQAGYTSDPEFDDPDLQYEQAQRKIKKKMTVKLYEDGPRIQMKLIKIQEGYLAGNVQYHRFVKKTPREIEEQRQKIKAKLKLKQQRKKEMEAIKQQKELQKELEKAQKKEKKKSVRFADEGEEEEDEEEKDDEEDQYGEDYEDIDGEENNEEFEDDEDERQGFDLQGLDFNKDIEEEEEEEDE